ncbi:MAG: diguanylate cyclase [Pseudobacteriovorax sp.]|nr:diguanylate cyclase [Pseudobacteriovorax sp.]
MERAKVLVVEKSKSQRLFIKGALDQEKFDFLEASTGQEAIEAIRNEDVDVVLVSWVLDDMEGLELIGSYQQDDTLLLPFIMLTSHAEESRIMTSLNAGAFDFIQKPAKSLELNARIHGAVKFRQLQRKFLEMAIRDPLTGLFNRRYLQQKMDHMLPSYANNQGTLALAIIDIDFFKKVNDTYGHDVGDVVIQQTGAILSAAVRDNDIVARIGGEEFVVVLPDTEVSQAREIMNRIRSDAEKKSWGDRENPLSITMSCGISEASLAEYNLDKILKLADEGLYYAKQNGRNQVVTPDQLENKLTA